MRSLSTLAVLLALCASGCRDKTTTRRVVETYDIVPGTPSVDTKTPAVLVDDAGDTDHFAVNVPRQCDVFKQSSVNKVDILWVIDSSGSMAPKQQRLKQNFTKFVQQLVSANPPIDFHIAVSTTDTDDPNVSGELLNWSLNGISGDFISCVPQMTGGVQCNTASAGTVDGGCPLADGGALDPDSCSAVFAFNDLTNKVGIVGSPQERGLYAAYLVLNNPIHISSQTTERFVRQDASLYVIIVSDEDDSSCDPLTRQPVCTADPGCRCANDNALMGAGNYGSTQYFTRFFETYKGYGNADRVTVAAIVGTNGDPDAGVPAQFLDVSPHIGCCISASGGACPATGTNAAVPDSGMEVAYYGSRYVQVASDTGGVSVNICQQDFSGALSALGYSASGLRTEYRLSRGPDVIDMSGVAQGFDVYETKVDSPTCMVDGNCPSGQICRSQRCATQLSVDLTVQPTGAQYVKCDGTVPRNVVRFTGSAVPDSLATVEICYDVKPDFQSTCP
jgi:hypothetical protein